MSDPNSVTVSIHAPLPADEPVVEALLAHMRELATDCQKSGWTATLNLTLTKDGAGPGGE